MAITPGSAAAGGASPPDASLPLSPSTRCAALGRINDEHREEGYAETPRASIKKRAHTLARMESTTLESTPLYERVVRDMGETTLAYDGWWEKTAEKYRWTRERPDQKWHVDFATCEVLLR
jgi:CXXX repeat modification system protein